MKTLGIMLIGLTILGILFAGNVFAEETGILKITSLQGKVLIKKAGTEDWVAAKVGDVLNKDDAVKTLEDGFVYLEAGPGLGFTIGPNSGFVVGNIIDEPPVAEPYSEPMGERIDNIMAPEVNEEGAASRI